mgnify:CR=1 FL=1
MAQESKIKDYDLFILEGALNSTTAVNLTLKGQSTIGGVSGVVTVPNDFVMKIKNGIITNTYTATITVTIQAYNGTTTVPLYTVEVPAGSTVNISDNWFSMTVSPGYYLQIVGSASSTGYVYLNAYFVKGGSTPF